jgi:hypothetical protein
VASLFTSQVPASTDNSDGAPGITFAVTLRFAQAGTVTAVRFYSTTTVSGTYTGAAWQVTASDAGFGGNGTLLASKVKPTAPTGGAWNTITFDTPVSVVPGVLYRFAVHSSAGRYVATLNFFTGALTNGDITAPADHSDPVALGELWQGTFTINAALDYPRQTGSSANYFVDVDYAPTSSTTPFTKDLAVSWRVLNAFSKDVAVNWRVLNSWTKDLAASWRVLNAFTKDVALVWSVAGLTGWSKDIDLQWRVLNGFSRDVVVPWRVLNGWTKDAELRWAVRAFFTKDVALRWRVLTDSPPTPLPAGVVAYLETRTTASLAPERVTAYLE